MQVGIVGLPQSGKTTLLNALTGQELVTGGFSGRESVNLGTARVPDPRLDALVPLFEPEKKIPATVDFIDVAGFAPAKEGERGISSELIGKMRNVNMLMAVVRAFENERVPHPSQSVDAERDFESLRTELLVADQTVVEARIEKLEKTVKHKKDPESVQHLELMRRCIEALEREDPLRAVEFSAAEEKLLRGYNFLTLQPLLVVVNIGEGDFEKEAEIVARFEPRLRHPGTRISVVSARIEAEIQGLEEKEAVMFREELGMKEPALDKLIRASYELLGLISFFTVGKDEVRAWTIRDGLLAPAAAGAIHGDIERGFIRAEVVSYEDFMKVKTLVDCKKAGTLRLEGKDYRVADGDIINYRFSV